jgi:hypothetical protein
MTKRDLIATALQLIGVFLACNVIATGMSFTAFGGSGQEMAADWMRIWIFNVAFWFVGLLFSVVLIFFAAPVAALLSSLTASGTDEEVRFGEITSEVVIQLFAGFLLIRQSYFAVLEFIQLFQFSSYGASRFIIIFLYFGATIGVSFWLIRFPELLSGWRRSKTTKSNAEQGGDGDA